MGSIVAPTIPLIPFTPQAQVISNITNANPAVVTTTQPHGYLSLLLVRFFLPPPTYFGMPSLNSQVFQITVLSPTTFSVPVDTTNLDPFSEANTEQVPQVTPTAENAFILYQAERNALPPISGGGI
jgi:hypothetical protein